MDIFSDYRAVPVSGQAAVIALGNFDGLHRGHQAVIAMAKDIALERGLPLAIGVFTPHPRRFFAPDSPPFRLMSGRRRAHILPQLGVDRLYEINFNADLKNMSDEEFVETVLHKGLGAAHILVGDDFRFGRDRVGDFDSLRAHCAARGIDVSGCEPVGLHKFYGKYGSTEIREALKNGDVFHAAHMLSRPWTVDGIVSTGAKRGRTIGFPTANVGFADLMRPKFGVYAVELRIDGEDIWRPAVANTGTRPTVDGTEARLEAHIFDFDRDIYGQMVDVRFRSFIRSEQKFDSFDVLAAQIKKDARGARAVLGAG
ncbi:bifunctional riboflavin kinase/FAD synthetase [Robiginitomaculum antarcticum]|uniref:bifunctional riboflavin kinase/FAD synthetase n=1 Tax=Robiginitomaculum antarcticum TaxID=437507 RepID=UPI000365946C|nr:bifunctional riboflavin kinase/FAD synthetase [Robiginitomaculum antarcticum]